MDKEAVDIFVHVWYVCIWTNVSMCMTHIHSLVQEIGVPQVHIDGGMAAWYMDTLLHT